MRPERLRGFGSSARTRTWNSSADELTAERKLFPDPVSTSPALQFPFPAHRFTASSKRLLMHQPPGARVPFRVQSAAILRAVVLGQTTDEIIGVAHVNLALRVEQNIHAVVSRQIRGFGSSARTRTWNPSVNSRMLYH